MLAARHCAWRTCQGQASVGGGIKDRKGGRECCILLERNVGDEVAGWLVAGDMGKRPTELLHQVTADPWAVLTSKQWLVRAYCSLTPCPSQQHLNYNSCWISEAIHCPAYFSNRQYFPIVN